MIIVTLKILQSEARAIITFVYPNILDSAKISIYKDWESTDLFLSCNVKFATKPS